MHLSTPPPRQVQPMTQPISWSPRTLIAHFIVWAEWVVVSPKQGSLLKSRIPMVLWDGLRPGIGRFCY